MKAKDEFFGIFTANLLDSIGKGEQGSEKSSFHIPRAVVAASELGSDPFPYLTTCRAMVLPKEEMIISYVHFFTERARDLRRGNIDSGAFTSLSIVKRLLEDFDSLDRENLCLFIWDDTFLTSYPQGGPVSLLILPDNLSERTCHKAKGVFTPLLPEDPFYRYGQALNNLLGPVSPGEKPAGMSVFGKLSIRDIRREKYFFHGE